MAAVGARATLAARDLTLFLEHFDHDGLIFLLLRTGPHHRTQIQYRLCQAPEPSREFILRDP